MISTQLQTIMAASDSALASSLGYKAEDRSNAACTGTLFMISNILDLSCRSPKSSSAGSPLTSSLCYKAEDSLGNNAACTRTPFMISDILDSSCRSPPRQHRCTGEYSSDPEDDATIGPMKHEKLRSRTFFTRAGGRAGATFHITKVHHR